MLYYITRRFVYMIITLFLITVVSFIIIQLPPGDYLTTYILQLQSTGGHVDEAEIAALKKQYGLDLPIYFQYFKWMEGIFHGNLGFSFSWNRSVNSLLAERLPLTITIALLTLIFTYSLAIPIGIYSAINQYSFRDYVFTFIGFIGLSVPQFIFALILMFVFYKCFGISIGGLFSMQYVEAPWSWAKFVDMINHCWAPIIVVGTGGTAWCVRVMRGCLLDELRKQYVITARAKGVSERTLILKYPVRVAINPIISTIGWSLPFIISGQIIAAIVLCLPTIGPLLFEALRNQDMYLAGSIVLIVGFLTIIGTFMSDMLLVLLDPRIRYDKK